MPELNLNITSDVSTQEGIEGELRAIKLAIALLASRLPAELNPEAVSESLIDTEDKHAVKLGELIALVLKEAKPRNLL